MTTLPLDHADAAQQPRWGLGDAVAGWMIAVVAATILGGASLALAGYDQADVDADRLPLWLTLVQSPFLWVGFIGVPVWVAATKGNGVVADFRLRLEARDVPLAVAAGVLAQLVLVPLVTLPILWLTNTDSGKLGEPAQKLADKVHGAPSTTLFVLVIAIGAPIAEELFFRGLLLRSLEKRFGLAWAVAGSSIVFGATHFEALQFLALAVAGAVFALVGIRTGRLGASMICHMAFNATTVVNLLWPLNFAWMHG